MRLNQSRLNKSQRWALYAVAFLIPPVLVATIFITSNVSNTMLRKTPEAPAGALLPPPQLKPGMPIALIVLSNVGTQLRETLSAAEALGSSGQYQVVTAAPERVLSPTTGEISILPDFNFANAPTPKLLVLPSVLDPQMPVMNTFVSKIAPLAKQVLALGEGVRLLIPSGLLQGKKATSHFLSIDELEKSTPQTHWIRSEVVRDGNIVTSSGVASTENAVREILSEPYTSPVPSTPAALSPLFFHAAFDWDKPKVAVVVDQGVQEGSLGQALDLYPRTFSYKTVSASPKRTWVVTAHGITLVAASSFDGLPSLDEIILPSGVSVENATREWILKTGAEVVTLTGNSNKTDQEILDRIAYDRPEIAQAAAYVIGAAWPLSSDEKPRRQAAITLSTWLWLRPFFLGILGLLLMRFFLRPKTN